MGKPNVTEMLMKWAEGDDAALNKMMPFVYDELHRLAGYYMRRQRPDHTLQATALVNEAYLKLIDARQVNWKSRAYFIAAAAQAMRHILIDHARSKQRVKRGEGAYKVSLDQASDVAEVQAADLIALDEALVEMSAIDPRKTRIVELRYFGGLNIEETAEVLGISAATVMRDWRAAKAFLKRSISHR